MFEITRLTVEHLAAGCVTDCSTPRIGFSLSSDRRGAQLADAELTVGDWSAHVTSGQSAAYVGPALLPFTTYSDTSPPASRATSPICSIRHTM